MDQTQGALKWLGVRAYDGVTGFMGVVTSVSFGLSGCISALLDPGPDNEGKLREQAWFDAKRLRYANSGGGPLMPQPDLAVVPGGELPIPDRPA